jgi:hypothetical protein
MATRADGTSEEVTFVEFDPVSFEKLAVLLLKRPLPVMLLLRFNIGPHSVTNPDSVPVPVAVAVSRSRGSLRSPRANLRGPSGAGPTLLRCGVPRSRGSLRSPRANLRGPSGAGLMIGTGTPEPIQDSEARATSSR